MIQSAQRYASGKDGSIRDGCICPRPVSRARIRAADPWVRGVVVRSIPGFVRSPWSTGRFGTVAVPATTAACKSAARMMGRTAPRGGIFGRRGATGNRFGIKAILAVTSGVLPVMNVAGPLKALPKVLDPGVGKCR